MLETDNKTPIFTDKRTVQKYLSAGLCFSSKYIDTSNELQQCENTKEKYCFILFHMVWKDNIDVDIYCV